MRTSGIPLWVYFVVAGAIAGLAFVVGQLSSGLGVAFAAGASTLWTAFAVSRERRLRSRHP